MADSKARVFISHVQEDLAYAGLLSDLLREKGLEVTSHEGGPSHSLERGEEDIEEEVRGADAMVVLVRENYLQSPHNLMEVGMAKAAGKRVIYILLSGTVEQLPFKFMKQNLLDARKTNKDTLLQFIEQSVATEGQ